MKKGSQSYYPPSNREGRGKNSQFREFEAVELYCPKCRKAVAVRKFLLLILPDGDKYEYRCVHCGSKVGDKLDRSGQFYGVLRT